jgi:hypothetical protein
MVLATTYRDLYQGCTKKSEASSPSVCILVINDDHHFRLTSFFEIIIVLVQIKERFTRIC